MEFHAFAPFFIFSDISMKYINIIIFRIMSIPLQKIIFSPRKMPTIAILLIKKHIPHVIITDITKESTKLYISPIPVSEIKY